MKGKKKGSAKPPPVESGNALTFAALAEAGFDPIPVHRHDAPVEHPGKQPIGAQWQKRTHTAAEFEQYEQAGHSIGLRCVNSKGIDIDVPDPKLADKVEATVRDALALNGTTPVRIGKAPKRLLVVRTDDDIPSFDIKANGSTLFQWLSGGKQFVVRGTHPDTGKPYHFTTPLPESVEALPVVTATQVAQMRDALVALFEAEGIEVGATGKMTATQSVHKGAFSPGVPWSKATNEAEQENVRAALVAIPPTCDRATWRDVGMALHDGFHGSQEGLDLYIAWSHGALHGEEMEARLATMRSSDGKRPKVASERQCAKEWRGYKPGGGVTRASLFGIAEKHGLGAPEASPAPRRIVAAPDAPPEGERFPAPPEGLLADIAQQILVNARKPVADAALLAACVTAAACLGNKYRLPDNTRLNLYALAAGGTGSGKDSAMGGAEEIVTAVNMALGGTVIGVQFGRMASGQGLEDALVVNNGELFWLHDESAHASAGSKGHVDPNRVGIDGAILQLWSASGRTYQTRVQANKQGKKQGGVPLSQPFLNMLEATTPSALSQYMTPASISQGRFGRMLFALLPPDTPPRRLKEYTHVPDALVHRLVELRRAAGDKLVTINVPDDVDALLDATMLELHEAATACRTEDAKALRQRSFEKVQRLAGLLAVLESKGKPSLREEHVRWARQLVEASDAIVVGELSTLLSDDVLEAQRLRVLDVLTRLLSGKLALRNEQQRRLAKEHGVVTRRQVAYHSKLDAKAFDMAIKTLLLYGQIGTGKASEQGIPVEEGHDPALFWLPADDDTEV